MQAVSLNMIDLDWLPCLHFPLLIQLEYVTDLFLTMRTRSLYKVMFGRVPLKRGLWISQAGSKLPSDCKVLLAVFVLTCFLMLREHLGDCRMFSHGFRPRPARQACPICSPLPWKLREERVNPKATEETEGRA